MKRFWKFALSLLLLCLLFASAVSADSEGDTASFNFAFETEGFTFRADTSYLEKLQLSESELDADTRTLLVKVLTSKYIGQYMYSRSVPYENVVPDFSDFNGFCELIARDDFEDVFAQYMKRYIGQACHTDLEECHMRNALELLRQPAVCENLSDETMTFAARILKGGDTRTGSSFQLAEITLSSLFTTDGK